jgi:hypothetical protein
MKMHIEYYKGEGSGFPQVRAMVSLVNLNLAVVHPNTENASTTCYLVYANPCE